MRPPDPRCAEPVDLGAVARDEEALEALRPGSEPDDPAARDRALGLLRDLLADVDRDLPAARHRLRLAPEPHRSSARWRSGGRGAAVGVLVVGVLSFGGVAAASSAAPVGSPLHGLAASVRSAAGAVVDAVLPSRPEAAPSPSRSRPEPTQRPPRPLPVLPPPTIVPLAPVDAAPGTGPSAPGTAVAAQAGSRVALRQVREHLDAATSWLDAGRVAAARQQLELAERRLTAVLSADGADALQAEAVALRNRIDAAARPGPGAKPSPAAGQPQGRTDPPEGRAEQKAPDRPRTDRPGAPGRG